MFISLMSVTIYFGTNQIGILDDSRARSHMYPVLSIIESLLEIL